MSFSKKLWTVLIMSIMVMGGLALTAQPAKAAALECYHLGHKISCILEGASGVDAEDWGFSGFTPAQVSYLDHSIYFPNPGCGYYTVNVTWNGNFYYQHSYDWEGWDLFC